MTKAGWVTGAENYFNRVTRAQIIADVREAKGDNTAELIADLKKKEMATEAERLIADTSWLPECLRTPEPLDTGGDAPRCLPFSTRLHCKPPSNTAIPSTAAARP